MNIIISNSFAPLPFGGTESFTECFSSANERKIKISAIKRAAGVVEEVFELDS
jgi:hypothetical protein